jgi:cation transport ATPase
LRVEKLKVGDQVHVRPGENFAVDGKILSGEGSVNEASITGESVPAYKGPDHPVYAGTTSLDGSFVVESTHVGDDRVMGKLIRLLEEARLKRAPIEQLADRVAAHFTPTVIVLTAITFVFWTWRAGFEQGLLIGLAVLLIACPCALGIATPLVIWTALGRAAQKGVLIRDSLTLEKLSQVRQIFFDKTGTLTTGESKLVEIAPCCDPHSGRAPAQQIGKRPAPGVGTKANSQSQWSTELRQPEVNLLQIAASLEQDSEHPLARSIQAAAAQLELSLLPTENFRALPGLGVSGVVAGRELYVGSQRLVEQLGLTVSDRLQSVRRRLEQAGLSVIHLGWNGSVQGLLGFAEEIRPTAQAALTEMQQQGISPQVLTGDSHAAGAALGQKLGVPVHSELLPQDKVRAVERTGDQTQVAMVGDGLNDAPALARASVGIALGCGTDVTREAADISLLGNDLSDVAWTLALAKRSYRTIGWNLTWAFAYNVIGIGLAMAGLLHPVIAAGVMVLSSALVVGNSLRILRY